MSARPIIAAYYFPNWHCDPRIEALHGKGWTEWRVVQYASPRFPGHHQPRVPLWGYQDEADPEVMAQKIAAARAYGIDAFIFDWYSFNDGPYRERCLNEGFLKAVNCREIEFAMMWCNHNPIYAHPGSYWKPAEVNWIGDDVTPETFRRETALYIEKYFALPNYLRVDKGLYFSIWQPRKMIASLGGEKAASKLFREFRARVRKAGLGELNLNAHCDCWDRGEGKLEEYEALLKKVGFDSIAEYTWGNFGPDFPAVKFGVWAANNRRDQMEKAGRFKGLYYPSVATGWDSSPRTVQSDIYERRGYPFLPVVVNNTPERFEAELEFWKEQYEKKAFSGGMLPLACWNEWTEGAYLEPDTEFGYGYLQAVKNVFGKGEEK